MLLNSFHFDFRLLYSDKLNRAAGVDLRRRLEDILAVFQQRALINNKKLRIERLSTEEQQHVQQLIIEQLRSGHLSERRGNIRDLQRIIDPSDPRCTCRKNVATSDSDSSTCNTVTLKPRVRGRSPNASLSVRPKSSQRIHAQNPKPLGNIMNIGDPSVVSIRNREIREKQQLLADRERRLPADNLCDSNSGNGFVNFRNCTQKGKKVPKGPSSARRSGGDDLSPGGPLSKQESPVFSVSMIKELQTSPMQVSGGTFQDKLREREDCSPPKRGRSSNSDSVPVESLIKAAEQRSGVSCVNGESSPFFLEHVSVKERAQKYSEMSNAKENAGLHQATAAASQPQQQQQQPPPSVVSTQSASTSKSLRQRKRQSFGAESQDSGDFDTTSVSNSGSDHRLSHLHETSSLEVELPSSHEENSSSHESDENPGVCDSQQNIPKSTSNDIDQDSSSGDHPCKVEDDRHLADVDESGSPKRPLVRARTFEVFHPFVDGSASSVEDPPTSTHRQEKVKVEKDPSSESETSSRSVSTHHVTFSSPKKSKGNPRDQKSAEGGKERKISDECISLYQESMVEDPEKLREIERKKGSLLFEHNFQTYSNIPTTNMMTASMMTASLSSESSMGVGSLYSSMMDSSAMLGSIHSLGGLDPPVVDPIPRPASVGLPIIHTMEEPSCVPHVVPNHAVLKSHQKSTEQMAMELQREIARRGQGTRSPSPDSLSVDLAGRRDFESAAQVDVSAQDTAFQVMENSNSSMNKEEMDDEEKEKDDRENESKSSESSNSDTKSDPKNDGVGSEALRSSLSNITGSPRLTRTVSENTPIVSGGSTLKREKESSDAPSIPKCDRQVSVSAVKDVDSIPLVFGYVGPQDEEEEEVVRKETKEKKESGVAEDEDKQPQSIFPMFIDFNELPTPSKEQAKEEEKKLASRAKAQSSGLYMYIEADAPSPKTRRKRKSESDGTASGQCAETRSEDGCSSSLPPVLPNVGKPPKGNSVKTSSKEEENSGGSDDGGTKEKKGFFMFIEAESSSKTNSPKPKRRQVPPPKKKTEVTNVMTRSAPSDSLLFSSPESSSKLMTKSVIDRDEFIAQPPTRKNVSLNDKINESSNSKESSFVSGIPRPIHALKSKSPTPRPNKVKGSSHKKDAGSRRESSVSRTKDEQPSETNDMATSRDISISELGPSLSVSLSEVMSSSLPKEAEFSEVSDVSSLLSSIDRSNGKAFL